MRAPLHVRRKYVNVRIILLESAADKDLRDYDNRLQIPGVRLLSSCPSVQQIVIRLRFGLQRRRIHRYTTTTLRIGMLSRQDRPADDLRGRLPFKLIPEHFRFEELRDLSARPADRLRRLLHLQLPHRTVFDSFHEHRSMHSVQWGLPDAHAGQQPRNRNMFK